jgi:hypothetical protein
MRQRAPAAQHSHLLLHFWSWRMAEGPKSAAIQATLLFRVMPMAYQRPAIRHSRIPPVGKVTKSEQLAWDHSGDRCFAGQGDDPGLK